MPQSTLEFTSNLKINEADIIKLMQNININLSSMLPASIESCKIGVHVLNHFLNGDKIDSDFKNNGYIFLNVRILKGRSQDVLMNTSKKLYDILNNAFSKNNSAESFKVAVEIYEFSDYFYKG